MKTTTPVIALLMAGAPKCGGGGGQPDAPVDTIVQHDAAIDSSMIDGTTGSPMTVFTIVLENHDYAEIVGSTNAPYINSLIASYGLATNYNETGSPSLPNYLHMISGANQYPGIIDVDPTSFGFPKAAQNLGTQLDGANIKWRSYQESMGTPCKLSGSGEYAPKHDPFLYFTDQQTPAAHCQDRNVDFSQFAGDLASNQYRYMWITPNLISDGHDPSGDPVTALKTSDTWLSTHVPQILASPGYQANGVLFITWDEAEGRNGDDDKKIPMIVISKRIKSAGITSATVYDHGSYLASVEELFGLPRLPAVATVPSMVSAFLN